MVKKRKLCTGAPKVTIANHDKRTIKIEKRKANVRKATRGKSFIVCANTSEYRLRDYGHMKKGRKTRKVVVVGNPKGKKARRLNKTLKKNEVMVTNIGEINQHHAGISDLQMEEIKQMKQMEKVKQIKKDAKENKKKAQDGIKKARESNATQAQKQRVIGSYDKVRRDSEIILEEANEVQTPKEAAELAKKNKTNKQKVSRMEKNVKGNRIYSSKTRSQGRTRSGKKR